MVQAGSGNDQVQVGTWTDGKVGPAGTGSPGTWVVKGDSIPLDNGKTHASKDFCKPHDCRWSVDRAVSIALRLGPNGDSGARLCFVRKDSLQAVASHCRARRLLSCGAGDPIKKRRIMWVWGTLPNGLQTIPRDMTYDPRTNKINCKPTNHDSACMLSAVLDVGVWMQHLSTLKGDRHASSARAVCHPTR